MYRYLAIIWNSLDIESTQASQSLRAALLSKPSEWPIAYDGPGALVAHTGLRSGSAESYPLRSNSGVVLGKVFDREQADYTVPRRTEFTGEETQRIVLTGGKRLIERYWGAYVAFIYDQSSSSYHVFREPTDNIPCYHTTYRGVHIFFSDIEDCVRLWPISFRINSAFLLRWLVFSSIQSTETGLDGVESMQPGERLTLSRCTTKRSLLWNPVEIAEAVRFDKVELAADELRSTVQGAVNAWASSYKTITHKLSGGLDSSIVAACLANAPSKPNVNCLNWELDVGFDQERLYLPGVDKRTEDKLRAIAGHGDERYFARLVAQRWSLSLIERKRDNALSLSRQWKMPLRVRPTLYATPDQDDFEAELARSGGTEAFFTGQNGDSVLVATTQPLAAIDFSYLHGIRSDFWRELVHSAKLSKEPLSVVLGKAIKYGILRRPYMPPSAVLDRPSLLRTELLDKLTHEDFEGPLTALLAHSAVPPGKRLHARSVGTVRYYDSVFFSGKNADYIHPLNSQPVWELMLRLPIYTALAAGVSRGLARRAFADLLPSEIRTRQAKGTGTPFYQQLVRRNKAFLREHLLDGLLVREGYLDRQKVHEYLAAEEPFLTVDSASVLFYFAAETWLQQWTSTRHELIKHVR